MTIANFSGFLNIRASRFRYQNNIIFWECMIQLCSSMIYDNCCLGNPTFTAIINVRTVLFSVVLFSLISSTSYHLTRSHLTGTHSVTEPWRYSIFFSPFNSTLAWRASSLSSRQLRSQKEASIRRHAVCSLHCYRETTIHAHRTSKTDV